MHIVKWAVVILGILVLGACATAGKQFSREHVNDVQVGVQDRAQIAGWFGKPYQKTPIQGHPKGCVERWTYVHAYASWGGAKARNAALVVDFDKDGKVCDHAYSESEQ